MKDGISLIWLEIVLGFGAPLAWGFWELYALRRDKRRAGEQGGLPTEPEVGPPVATPHAAVAAQPAAGHPGDDASAPASAPAPGA